MQSLKELQGFLVLACARDTRGGQLTSRVDWGRPQPEGVGEGEAGGAAGVNGLMGEAGCAGWLISTLAGTAGGAGAALLLLLLLLLLPLGTAARDTWQGQHMDLVQHHKRCRTCSHPVQEQPVSGRLIPCEISWFRGQVRLGKALQSPCICLVHVTKGHSFQQSKIRIVVEGLTKASWASIVVVIVVVVVGNCYSASTIVVIVVVVVDNGRSTTATIVVVIVVIVVRRSTASVVVIVVVVVDCAAPATVVVVVIVVVVGTCREANQLFSLVHFLAIEKGLLEQKALCEPYNETCCQMRS